MYAMYQYVSVCYAVCYAGCYAVCYVGVQLDILRALMFTFSDTKVYHSPHSHTTHTRSQAFDFTNTTITTYTHKLDKKTHTLV